MTRLTTADILRAAIETGAADRDNVGFEVQDFDHGFMIGVQITWHNGGVKVAKHWSREADIGVVKDWMGQQFK